jgi:putative endonuclease
MLRLKGYTIVARRRRGLRGSGVGEVDIIARRGRTVAFVEVKLRAAEDQAAAAVLPRQRRRLTRAAQAFLAERPELSAASVRFDAMLVSPWRLPRHLIDAWRDEG